MRVEVSPTARFGRNVVISLDPGTSSALQIGPGVHLHDGVTILLRGGSLRIDEGARVRRGSVFNVAGELEIGPRSLLSYYNVVHCAQLIRVGEQTVFAEFVTIVDSVHTDEGPSDYFYENSKTGTIDIGRRVWIGAKATVLMDVNVGDGATIGAHSLVREDVEAGSVVGGVPARPLRPAG